MAKRTLYIKTNDDVSARDSPPDDVRPERRYNSWNVRRDSQDTTFSWDRKNNEDSGGSWNTRRNSSDATALQNSWPSDKRTNEMQSNDKPNISFRVQRRGSYIGDEARRSLNEQAIRKIVRRGSYSGDDSRQPFNDQVTRRGSLSAERGQSNYVASSADRRTSRVSSSWRESSSHRALQASPLLEEDEHSVSSIPDVVPVRERRTSATSDGDARSVQKQASRRQSFDRQSRDNRSASSDRVKSKQDSRRKSVSSVDIVDEINALLEEYSVPPSMMQTPSSANKTNKISTHNASNKKPINNNIPPALLANYDNDNKLSNTEFFHRMKADELVLLQELKKWKQKYNLSSDASLSADDIMDSCLKLGDNELTKEQKEEYRKKMEQMKKMPLDQMLDYVQLCSYV